MVSPMVSFVQESRGSMLNVWYIEGLGSTQAVNICIPDDQNANENPMIGS